MSYFLGAYAASPSLHNEWDARVETHFMARLREMDLITGLEVAFYEDFHLHDSTWFLKQLRPDWRYLLTGIPGTMDQLAKSPDFGLASVSHDGRLRAWAFAQKMRTSVEKIHQFFGRPVVKAVVIHSAPRLYAAPTDEHRRRFSESLAELAAWDWHGAELWVEHCDRAGQGTKPAKGFLSIDDELTSVEANTDAPTPLGILINWGRSALEARRVQAPLEHIELIHRQGLLRGVMFSGCTVNDSLYGDWADSHAPFAPTSEVAGLTTSLMTQQAAADCIKAAGQDLLALGLKIQALPADLSVVQRLELVERSLKVLDTAATGAFRR